MTSIVYPVGGGLEDWAYAAGWDKTKDLNSAINVCTPRSWELPEKFFDRWPTDNIRCAIFLVETDDHKDPPARFYGARILIPTQSGKSILEGGYRVGVKSIESSNSKYNGHINRNIRLAMTVID